MDVTGISHVEHLGGFEATGETTELKPLELAGQPLSRSLAARMRGAVIDPELGVNIVDLGLVYDLRIENAKVTVTITLTTRSSMATGTESRPCPRWRSLDHYRAGVHHPARHPDRATKLQPQLRPAHSQGGSLQDHCPRYPEDLRLPMPRS